MPLFISSNMFRTTKLFRRNRCTRYERWLARGEVLGKGLSLFVSIMYTLWLDSARSLVMLLSFPRVGPMLRFRSTDTTSPFSLLVYAAPLVRLSTPFTAYGVTARLAFWVTGLGKRRGGRKPGADGRMDGWMGCLT